MAGAAREIKEILGNPGKLPAIPALQCPDLSSSSLPLSMQDSGHLVLLEDLYLNGSRLRAAQKSPVFSSKLIKREEKANFRQPTPPTTNKRNEKTTNNLNSSIRPHSAFSSPGNFSSFSFSPRPPPSIIPKSPRPASPPIFYRVAVRPKVLLTPIQPPSFSSYSPLSSEFSQFPPLSLAALLGETPARPEEKKDEKHENKENLKHNRDFVDVPLAVELSSSPSVSSISSRASPVAALEEILGEENSEVSSNRSPSENSSSDDDDEESTDSQQIDEPEDSPLSPAVSVGFDSPQDSPALQGIERTEEFEFSDLSSSGRQTPALSQSDDEQSSEQENAEALENPSPSPPSPPSRAFSSPSPTVDSPRSRTFLGDSLDENLFSEMSDGGWKSAGEEKSEEKYNEEFLSEEEEKTEEKSDNQMNENSFAPAPPGSISGENSSASPQQPPSLVSSDSRARLLASIDLERQRFEEMRDSIARERAMLEIEKKYLDDREAEFQQKARLQAEKPLVEFKIVVQPEKIRPPPLIPLNIPQPPPLLVSPTRHLGQPIRPVKLKFMQAPLLTVESTISPSSVESSPSPAPEIPEIPFSPSPAAPPAAIAAYTAPLLHSPPSAAPPPIEDRFIAAESLAQLKLVRSPDEIEALTPATRKFLFEAGADHLPFDETFKQFLGIEKQLEKAQELKDRELPTQRGRRRSQATPRHHKRRSSIDFRTLMPDFWLFLEYSIELPEVAAVIVELHTIRGGLSRRLVESEPIILNSSAPKAAFPFLVNVNDLVHMQLARDFLFRIMKFDRRTDGVEPRRCVGEASINLVRMQKFLNEAIPIRKERPELAGTSSGSSGDDRSFNGNILGSVLVHTARLFIDSSHGYSNFPPTALVSGPEALSEAERLYTQVKERLGNRISSDALRLESAFLKFSPPFPSCLFSFNLRMENILLGRRASRFANYLASALPLPPSFTAPSENRDPIAYQLHTLDLDNRTWKNPPLVASEVLLGSQLAFKNRIVDLFSLCSLNLNRPVLCRILNRANGRLVHQIAFTPKQIIAHSKVRFKLKEPVKDKLAGGAALDTPHREESSNPNEALSPGGNPVPALIFSDCHVYSALNDLPELCLAAGLSFPSEGALENLREEGIFPLGIHQAAVEEKDRLEWSMFH